MRLAFCMTINKSQGKTIELVGINLRREGLEHGLLYSYVALSRVTAWSGVETRLSPEHRDINE